MSNNHPFPTVTLYPCHTYEKEEVSKALQAVLDPLGGLDFVTKGMTVGIKANLVSAMKPHEAATTHPALLCALVDLLFERGAGRVIIGDSPGGLYTSAFVGHVYDATGMKETVSHGAELNQDFSTKEVQFPSAKVLKFFSYTAWLDACDAIVDFCKLKSHGMMGMSAAAKNMFGVIPGTMKPEYHFRFPNMGDFAHMLIDINDYFAEKVKLCLVDAVEGMEGNGPTQGTPRHIGLLLASVSPHAVDLVCGHLLGLSLDAVPTLVSAQERGYIPSSIEELPLQMGKEALDMSQLSALVIKDFEHIAVRHSLLFESRGKLVGGVIRSLLNAKPKLLAKDCIGCGKCEKICPAHAIVIKNKKAVIHRPDCIRCFCCQEFCPTGAMKVHRTWVARLLVKG